MQDKTYIAFVYCAIVFVIGLVVMLFVGDVPLVEMLLFVVGLYMLSYAIGRD